MKETVFFVQEYIHETVVKSFSKIGILVIYISKRYFESPKKIQCIRGAQYQPIKYLLCADRKTDSKPVPIYRE